LLGLLHTQVIRVINFTNFIRKVRNSIKGYYYTKRKGVKLFLSLSGTENYDVRKSFDLYNKIRVKNEESKIKNSFFCPYINNYQLKKTAKKSSKIAGVIGDISNENQLEKSIENAISDGMKKVIIYGYMKDPLYFYEKIVPICSKYKDKVQFAGAVENLQEIYDNISDVYFSPAKKIVSYIPSQCKIANVKFHGNDNVLDAKILSEEEIVSIWRKNLNV
jgi:hypothetical protein